MAPAGKYPAYRLPIVLLTIRSLNYQFPRTAFKETLLGFITGSLFYLITILIPI